MRTIIAGLALGLVATAAFAQTQQALKTLLLERLH